MVSAVVALAINQIVSKIAMSKGTSFYILSVYSNGLATHSFPHCLSFSQVKAAPMIVSCSLENFRAGFFWLCFAEIGSYAGINDSSPTLSTAILILVPAFTYILAIIFGMEVVNFRRSSTLAKSLGTVVSISGALIVTFYKGPAILNTPLTSRSSTQLHLPPNQNWASILKMYPVEMIVVALYCFFVTILSSLVTLIAERDLCALRIETNIGLMAVFYAAIINVSYRLYVTAWCIWKTGPFFVSLFKPLTIVVAIVIGVIFMKDVLYLGSLVGALVLISGFYAVMWGKAKEREIDVGTESSIHEAPLLQDDIEEM
ncbi:hypothetical protein OROGR_003621 [Orobanche gracilis]